MNGYMALIDVIDTKSFKKQAPISHLCREVEKSKLCVDNSGNFLKDALKVMAVWS